MTFQPPAAAAAAAAVPAELPAYNDLFPEGAVFSPTRKFVSLFWQEVCFVCLFYLFSSRPLLSP